MGQSWKQWISMYDNDAISNELRKKMNLMQWDFLQVNSLYLPTYKPYLLLSFLLIDLKYKWSDFYGRARMTDRSLPFLSYHLCCIYEMHILWLHRTWTVILLILCLACMWMYSIMLYGTPTHYHSLVVDPFSEHCKVRHCSDMLFASLLFCLWS